MMKKLKKNNSEREKEKNGESEKFSFLNPLLFSLLTTIILLNLGCQPNKTILKDVPPSPSPLETVEMKKTSFEQDLRDMQTANFDYIFVFRRKDGGVFDNDDRKYLRQNTPPETNRWTSTEEGKAFIAGSGFNFSPDQMEALRNRFVVEDFSKPETNDAANQAVNANTAKPNKANANK